MRPVSNIVQQHTRCLPWSYKNTCSSSHFSVKFQVIIQPLHYPLLSLWNCHETKKWNLAYCHSLLLRFIIGGILYYVIVYQFQNVMQYVVKRIRQYYMFDASDVEVSLWKNIVLTNAVLSPRYINTTSLQCEHLTRISYYCIIVWSYSLFTRRVSVDSLAIVLPSLSPAHEHDLHPQNRSVSNITQVSDMP